MSDCGFTPIIAIFYAVFHPTEGTKIVHQVPEGAISTHPTHHTPEGPAALSAAGLFSFDTVKNYVIPKPQLCGRLVTFKVNQYKIVGFPITIKADKYTRNSFNFNFCFVFPYDSELIPYEAPVRKIAEMFAGLERESGVLSRADPDVFCRPPFSVAPRTPDTETAVEPGGSCDPELRNSHYLTNAPHAPLKAPTMNLFSLLQQIHQDLNSYLECLIPLDDSNAIDIKLFPIFAPPPPLKSSAVPVATVRLAALTDFNWDPTMVRLVPFINGINSLKRISVLADTDLATTRVCVQHLMYYQCIRILDVFQMSAIYAPTSNISGFLYDAVAAECQAAVVRPGADVVPSKSSLFFLYRSLHQGSTVRDWLTANGSLLLHIDIRRFISFGVLRGLIYRVHSFPLCDASVTDADIGETATALRYASAGSVGRSRAAGSNEYLLMEENGKFRVELRSISFRQGNRPLLEQPRAIEAVFDSDDDAIDETQPFPEKVRLVKMLRAVENMDTICTELGKPRAEVERLVKSLGAVSIINS